MRTDGAGFVAGTFVLVGLGVGVAATLMTGWAEVTFATEAGGDAERFGPIFVAQLYLAVTAAALFGAPLLAGVLGLLVGSRAHSSTDAAASCGVGSAVGALGYGIGVVGIVVLSRGAAASQAYAVGDAVGPILGIAVVTGAVGALAGVAGLIAG